MFLIKKPVEKGILPDDLILVLLHKFHMKNPAYRFNFDAPKVHEIFYKMKNEKKYSDVLKNIWFSKKPNYLFSKEIEDSFIAAQISNFIGKENPDFHVAFDKIEKLRMQNYAEFEKIEKMVDRKTEKINSFLPPGSNLLNEFVEDFLKLFGQLIVEKKSASKSKSKPKTLSA
jgi:hypothetical protein